MSSSAMRLGLVSRLARALRLACAGEKVHDLLAILSEAERELARSKVTPVGDRVLLRRDPEQQASAGGIIMPFTSNLDLQVGTILAVGEGVKEKSLLQVGARCLFVRVQGVKHQAGDDRFAILKEDALLAVLEGEGDVLKANTWTEANSAA